MFMIMKKTLNKINEDKEIIPSEKEVTPSEISIIKNSCAKVGMSIDDYVYAIKAALKADKTTIDKYGEEHVEPDHDKRLKAAMIGLELEGYIKNKIVTGNDNSKHTHVVYSWNPVQVINSNIPSRIE